jgi:hypothetical protein
MMSGERRCCNMSVFSSNDHVLDSGAVGKYEALAMLYLHKQDLAGVTPEEIVLRYIETEERIKKEFLRQKELRKRQLNPLPL